MTLTDAHTLAVQAELALAALTVVWLLKLSAPYGRHGRPGWGPTIPARVGWVVMESPAVLATGAWFLSGTASGDAAPRALIALWMLHYVHRTFIFPFRMRADGKTMPAMVAGLAVAFNLLNAFVNGAWVGGVGSYPDAWLSSPAFLLGAALFLSGMGINLWADNRLFALRDARKPGDDYQIPRGGLYELISCPNYFGEMLEWLGWAIATWSLAGLAFFAYTVANLAPRAIQHHRWYHERFPDYPAGRKALVPWLL